jgi:hypothetical protein
MDFFVDFLGVFLLSFTKQPGTASSNSQEQREMLARNGGLPRETNLGRCFSSATKSENSERDR